jgi:hypothetical protein
MRDPIILHDHIIGHHESFLRMFKATEEGRLDPGGQEAAWQFVVPGKGFARSTHLLWMLLVGYRKFGQQTFVVGPRLREMLENTSLTGAPTDAIRFPYDYFYVATPESGLRLWSSTTGWHDVEGIVVGRSTERAQFVLYIWGIENEKSTYVGDDASFWLDVSLVEADSLGLDVEAYVEHLISNPKREYDGYGYAEGAIEDYAKDEKERLSAFGEHHEVRVETRRTVQAALRVALNLAIYLQHEGVERSEHPAGERTRRERKRIKGEIERKKNPNKKKARHLLRELEKLSDAHITWLGRTIEETVEREPSSGGGAPTVRFWVRGHWYPRLDNVEARKRHKLRWVRPYEKNKDAEATEPSRHYHIAENEETTP